MTYAQGVFMSNTINTAQRIAQLQVEIQNFKNEAKKAQVNALKSKDWTHHSSLIEKISKRNNKIARLKRDSSSSQPSASKKQDTGAVAQKFTREQIKEQIVEANTKAKNADSKMRVALKNRNQQQIETYKQKRDQYNVESKRLQHLLSGIPQQEGASSLNTQAFSREEIKTQIVKASEKAKVADANMRTALRNKKPDLATSHRKERDSHNVEVKRLQQLLKSIASGSQIASNQSIKALSASELAKYKTLQKAREKRLHQLPFEIKHANKMIDLYVKNKSDKRHEWSRKLKKLLAEKQTLQKLSAQEIKREQASPESKIANKEQKKSQVVKAKEKTSVEDSDMMRTALKNQESEHATTHREERDYYYDDAKRLQLLLTPLSDAEQEEYVLLKSRMKWWKSKGEYKNIQNNQAHFAELGDRYSLYESKEFTQGATGSIGAQGTIGLALTEEQIKEKIAQLKIEASAAQKKAQQSNLKEDWDENKRLIGEIKRLRQTTEGKSQESQTKPQGSVSDISQIVATYAKDPRQDTAQMRIIKLLLDTKYPADNTKINPYDRVRGALGETLAPLFLFRGDKLYLYKNRRSMSEDPNKVNTRTITTDEKKLFSKIDLSGKIIAYSHFIRDFMQIQGPFTKPIVIDGILINDFMAASEEKHKGQFVKEFNTYADKVSKHPLVKGIHPPVEHFHEMAHRDGFQLIPSNRPEHFAGEVLEHVTIQNTVIYSEGDLQGIFATDGAFKNIHILNNHIQTKGKYHISISGMLTGCTISGNKDMQDKPLHASKITLYPLRIGGGANILIVGFDNTGISNTHPHYYHYGDVKGVYDYRRCGRASDRQGALNPKKPSAYFYTDVHMATFWTHYKKDKVNGGNAHQMKALMNKLEKIGKAKCINKKTDLDKLAKKFKQT